MARYSYPTRSSRPGVFRQASREAVQRRRRLAWLRTGSAGTTGVLWRVWVDWDGDGYGTTPEDDITADVLHRSGVTVEYGRDQARALMPMTSGRATAEIDNHAPDGEAGRYSPDNTGSPLAGRILPARPIRLQARLSGRNYTIFNGQIDDYTVQARTQDQSIALSMLDPIAELKGALISTQLHKGIRTGEAIGLVLDAIGWPADARDLDLGATYIRWWWEEGADAYTAVSRILLSEGPGTVFYADERGRFVFRDRHHRLLAPASTAAQASFEPDTPLRVQDLQLDMGWRDIINAVSVQVDEYDPAPLTETVWESADVRAAEAGDTLTIDVELDNAVIDPEVSFTTSAGVFTSAIVQESGQRLTLELTAGTSTAVLQDLVVTGRPVTARRTYQVRSEDSASISKYGRRAPTGSVQAQWAGVHDAAAIADLMVGARSERLPVATIMLASGTAESSPRLLQQLSRDLLDRVHVRETRSALDGDFFVERIKHRVSDGGMLLQTHFTLEKAAQQAVDVFRFDDADYGFDNGVFGGSGLDDPENILLFDVDGRGFDDGVFAT